MSALSYLAKFEYLAELGTSLPPPFNNTTERRDRRHITAIEAFEALRPGHSDEARLAVQIVLAGTHASDCLRLAGLHRDDCAIMMRCRALATSLMREERAAKRMLAQAQKMRLAVEAVADSAPARQPASAEPPQAKPGAAPPPAHVVTATPKSAPAAAPKLQPAATSQPAPIAAPARPAAAPPRQATANPAPQQAAAASAPPPSPEAIAQAEAFALEHPIAAAQIRDDRGITPKTKAQFHNLTLPTDPAVIDALVRGTGEVLPLREALSDKALDLAA